MPVYHPATYEVRPCVCGAVRRSGAISDWRSTLGKSAKRADPGNFPSCEMTLWSGEHPGRAAMYLCLCELFWSHLFSSWHQVVRGSVDIALEGFRETKWHTVGQGVFFLLIQNRFLGFHSNWLILVGRKIASLKTV